MGEGLGDLVKVRFFNQQIENHLLYLKSFKLTTYQNVACMIRIIYPIILMLI